MRGEDEESLFKTGVDSGAYKKRGLLQMKFVFSTPETIVCASLTIGGAYMLKEGIGDRSATASVLVLAGAAFLATGIVGLQAAVRSILWHRAMLQRAPDRKADATGAIGSNHE